MLLFSQIVGIIGVIMIMIAYFLLEKGDLDAHQLMFPLVNFIGALLIVFSLLFAWNLPSFLMESSWALISFYGLTKIRKDK
jgi:hypothetical protein